MIVSRGFVERIGAEEGARGRVRTSMVRIPESDVLNRPDKLLKTWAADEIAEKRTLSSLLIGKDINQSHKNANANARTSK